MRIRGVIGAVKPCACEAGPADRLLRPPRTMCRTSRAPASNRCVAVWPKRLARPNLGIRAAARYAIRIDMNETSARKRRDEHACPASATRSQPAVREAALAAKRSQPIDPNEMPSRIDTAMSTRKRDRMRGVSDARRIGCALAQRRSVRHRRCTRHGGAAAVFVRKHPYLYFTHFTSRGEPRWHSRFSVATVAASGD